MRKNNKGSVRDIIIFPIILFALGIGFLAIFFTTDVVRDAMLLVPQISENNATATAIDTGTDKVINRMDYIYGVVFLGLFLAIIITGYFIGGEPIFMIVYFIVIIMAVITSGILSNIWEDYSQSSVFEGDVTNFPLTNNILLNLPIYTSVFAFIGIIAMFAKPAIKGAT